jgi:hypothetical protein
MQPVNQTDYVLADNEAPEFMVHVMYALLDDDNKKKIIDYVEHLRAEQRTLQPCPGFPC